MNFENILPGRIGLQVGVVRSERRLAAVPVPVMVLVVLGLVLQIGWHILIPAPTASARDLPVAPAYTHLYTASIGEPVAFSKMLMLWLQAFDNQPGISVPFRQLDYSVLVGWLGRIMQLDPRGHYPLLAAGRVYAEVSDEPRKRQMLEFVYQQFLDSPNTRWRWLAHASLVAKHRIQDLDLALRYAEAIRLHATGPEVPFWARDLSVILLEEMGELEAAKVLLGELIDSGLITDPYELRFLEGRLQGIGSAASGITDEISSDR